MHRSPSIARLRTSCLFVNKIVHLSTRWRRNPTCHTHWHSTRQANPASTSYWQTGCWLLCARIISIIIISNPHCTAYRFTPDRFKNFDKWQREYYLEPKEGGILQYHIFEFGTYGDPLKYISQVYRDSSNTTDKPNKVVARNLPSPTIIQN